MLDRHSQFASLIGEVPNLQMVLRLQNHDDESSEAEIQHLKVAIWALRGELDASKALHDDEKQEIRDAFEAQLSDLHATIRVLRTELEQTQDHSQLVQTEITAASDLALQQLRSAVATMRLELERGQVELEEALSASARPLRDEIAHLQDTIRALRQNLEEANG